MEYPGKPLKRGSEGPAVKAIQAQLKCQQTGVFGPTTEKLVKEFQATHADQFGNPMIVDGEVGPITWAILFGLPKPEQDGKTTLAKKVMAIAKSQIGVKEQPLGSNRGPEVDRYLASVSCAPGNPWCMGFVYWCFGEAAKAMKQDNPAHKSASCSAVFRWAKRNGKRVGKPQPGDIFLVKGGRTGHCHTGIVTGVEGGFIRTVEGNTNSAGSAEGLCVMARTRKAHTCDYVRVA